MYQADPWSGAEAFDYGTVRLPRLGEGLHVLKVLRCTMPKDKVALILEFEVVQSTNVSHEPGSQRSVYLASQFRESMMRQVNAAVGAIYGVDPKDDAARARFLPHASTIIRKALSDENFLEGRTVGCEGVPGDKTNPKTGERYVNYLWNAMSEPGALPPPGSAPAVPAGPPGWRMDPTTGQWVPA